VSTLLVRIVAIEDVLSWLSDGPPGLVVITGGEPLLQPLAVEGLVDAIRGQQLATDIEIETSGTIAPTPLIAAAVTRFNVSPKLAHSRLRRHQRIRPAVLTGLAASGKARWKFVAHDVDDLDAADDGSAEIALCTAMSTRHNTVCPFLALLGESPALSAAQGGRQLLAAVPAQWQAVRACEPLAPAGARASAPRRRVLLRSHPSAELQLTSPDLWQQVNNLVPPKLWPQLNDVFT
jgi:hypothetical protein